MKLFRWSNTISANTSITLALGLCIYTLLSTFLVFYFILSPMADRAANDMAALIDSIGQSWNSISADHKEAFQLHFREHHDLFITENDVELTEIKQFYPFIPRLEKALRHHTGKSLSIKQGVAEDTEDLCFWVTIPLSEQSLRIDFYTNVLGHILRMQW